MKLYYISGKITDVSREKERENLEKFNIKDKELRSQGHVVFNPASHEVEGTTWEQYLAFDIIFIVNNKPTLYMMKGWEESRGARLEHETALLLNLDIIYE